VPSSAWRASAGVSVMLAVVGTMLGWSDLSWAQQALFVLITEEVSWFFSWRVYTEVHISICLRVVWVVFVYDLHSLGCEWSWIIYVWLRVEISDKHLWCYFWLRGY
jgi:hypothetical protein